MNAYKYLSGYLIDIIELQKANSCFNILWSDVNKIKFFTQ